MLEHTFEDYRVDGSEKFKLADYPTSMKADKALRAEVEAATAENVAKMSELQNRFYADGKEGLIILFQAMDAAGKDGTIKHVMSGVNPQGVKVTSFKTPNSEELVHDYLWRVNKALPERGHIGIFNRSYYEDVLVVDVHDIQKNYHMSERCIGLPKEEFFAKRYAQINGYEEYLNENSYRVVKFFLNVSKKEQKKRFLSRIDDESKNWKFSSSDIKERQYWDDYQAVYEKVIGATSTKECPWYVIPADQKWVMRYLVSQVIVDTLEKLDPQYPVLPEEEKARLAECKEMLLNE